MKLTPRQQIVVELLLKGWTLRQWDCFVTCNDMKTAQFIQEFEGKGNAKNIDGRTMKSLINRGIIERYKELGGTRYYRLKEGWEEQTEGFVWKG